MSGTNSTDTADADPRLVALARDLQASHKPPPQVLKAMGEIDRALLELGEFPRGPSAHSAQTPPQSPLPQPSPAPAGGKHFSQSLTVWGAVVTAIVAVLPLVGKLSGIPISPAAAQLIGDHLLTIGQALLGIAGLAMTIWGRARVPSDPLVLRTPKPEEPSPPPPPPPPEAPS